jgi:hypothetical protein
VRPEHIVMALTALVSLTTLVKMLMGKGTEAGVESEQIKALIEGVDALRGEIKALSHARLLPLEKDVAVLRERMGAHADETNRRLQVLEAHHGSRR